MDTVQELEHYLSKNSIDAFITSMMTVCLKEKPEEPAQYLLKYMLEVRLRGLSCVGLQRAGARAHWGSAGAACQHTFSRQELHHANVRSMCVQANANKSSEQVAVASTTPAPALGASSSAQPPQPGTHVALSHPDQKTQQVRMSAAPRSGLLRAARPAVCWTRSASGVLANTRAQYLTDKKVHIIFLELLKQVGGAPHTLSCVRTPAPPSHALSHLPAASASAAAQQLAAGQRRGCAPELELGQAPHKGPELLVR